MRKAETLIQMGEVSWNNPFSCLSSRCCDHADKSKGCSLLEPCCSYKICRLLVAGGWHWLDWRRWEEFLLEKGLGYSNHRWCNGWGGMIWRRKFLCRPDWEWRTREEPFHGEHPKPKRKNLWDDQLRERSKLGSLHEICQSDLQRLYTQQSAREDC